MRKLKLFLSLLMVMAFSLGNVWGQAAKGTTLFSENFSGYAADAVPTGSVSSETGNRVVYGGGSVTYTSADNGTNITKIYSANVAGGTAPELLIGKNGGVFTIAGIPSGGAKEITVSFYQNVQKLTVSLNGTGYSTTYNSPKPTAVGLVSFDITVADGADDTFTLVFTAGSSNVRFDDISIIVKTAGTPASCSNLVTITKGAETNGTYTLSATEICGDGEGEDVTISNITPAPGFAFDEITTSASGTVDNENKKVTGITANTTITVLFKELQKYTVSFNTGAGNPTQDAITETTAGAGITLPAGPTPACSASGWIFAGWAAEAVASETTTAPTLLSGNYNPTDNVTLYAVYKRTEGGSGAAVNTVMWSENFTGIAADAKPETPTDGGSSVYGDATITYEYTDGGTKTKGYTTGGPNNNENLLVSKGNGAFTVKGIPTGGATTLTVTHTKSGSGVIVVSTPTENVTLDGETLTIGNPSGISTFDLVFSNTNSSNNERLDDMIVKVATTSAAGTTYYLSAPSCCTKHSVNVALGIQYGKVEADLTEACEGTVVTLTATPNEHCRFVEWDVKQGETPVSVSDSKFTMPAGDVTVSAVFAEIKNAVKVSDPEHGTINVTGAANLDEVLEGTELEVSVTGSGYKFTLDAYKYGETETKVTITDGKLTMPAYDIVITAEEEKLVSPTILVSKDVVDFGTAVKGGAAPAFETFTISGANLTGDLALAWETTDGYFAWEITEGSLTANAGIVEATVRVNVTAKGMSVADTHMDNLIVSGGGATQKEVMVGVEVQQTYTAKWFVNGEELTESTQTAVAGTDLIVPTNPTKLADDCAEMVFKGWAEAAIEGKQDDAPAYTEKTKMPEADVNFYAVFASEVPGAPVQKVDNIDNAFTGVSGNSYVAWTDKVGVSGAVYAGNTAGDHTTVQMRSNNSNSGLVVTSTGAGKVTNVTVAWNTNTAATRTIDIYGKNTPYSAASDLYGENAGTLLGSINIDNATSLDVTGDYTYIGIRSNSGALYLDNIAVEWTVPGETTYTDYMTTCPSCPKVNLMKAATEHGAYSFQQSGIAVTSVKTCEAATVNVVFEPELGYELANFQISELDGVSYADGVLTIAQNAAGNLTTTATFAPKNYSVTMEQTGDAEAEISGNQENKHYGNEITVTAGEKAGYYFLGWAADVEVAFADAKAYETTFPMPASNVKVTAKYAKILSVAEALALIPNEDDTYNNAVVEAYVASVKNYSDTYKSIDYYIQDLDENGFSTETWMLVYGGKGMNGAEFSSKDGIKDNAKVIIFGQLKNFKGTKEFSTNSYLLLHEEAEYEGLRIYGEATNTEYEVGDAFSFAGLKAKHVYSNGRAVSQDPTWKADPYYIAATTTVVSVTATNGTVVSPAVNVPVTVKTHKVTITTPANGTLVVVDKGTGEQVADGDKFVKDTELKITAAPNAGYKLETLTVNGVDFENGEVYKVGTEDITIVATFVKDSSTGIDNTEAGETAVKVMKNGQLFIIKNGKTFNAQGAVVK